jgi:hypothetical protein
MLVNNDDVQITVSGETFDEWRSRHFSPAELLDPAISGADADPDADGHTNTQEFTADTNPRDPDSVLKIVALTATTRNYTLQSRADSPVGVWENLQQIPAPTQAGVVTVTVPAASGSDARWYRVVTPAQP